MSRHRRHDRRRPTDLLDGTARDAERARRSASLARAGVWKGVSPEAAESYAVARLEDAAIIERVYAETCERCGERALLVRVADLWWCIDCAAMAVSHA